MDTCFGPSILGLGSKVMNVSKYAMPWLSETLLTFFLALIGALGEAILCVRLSVILCAEFLQHSKEWQARKQAGKEASRQAGKHQGQQAR